MRTIRTIDGEEISGLDRWFTDHSDHVETKVLGVKQKIYRRNIATDTEGPTLGQVAVVAAGVGALAWLLSRRDKKWHTKLDQKN